MDITMKLNEIEVGAVYTIIWANEKEEIEVKEILPNSVSYKYNLRENSGSIHSTDKYGWLRHFVKRITPKINLKELV